MIVTDVVVVGAEFRTLWKVIEPNGKFGLSDKISKIFHDLLMPDWDSYYTSQSGSTVRNIFIAIERMA